MWYRLLCQHDRSNWRAVAIILHFLKTSQIFTPYTGCYNIIKFPTTRITAKVITLKHSLINAVLLIVTEWPTLMPSLTSLTIYFPTSCEPKRWTSFFLSLFMYRLSTWKGSVSLFLTFPTDMDKILFVFPLDQQL